MLPHGGGTADACAFTLAHIVANCSGDAFVAITIEPINQLRLPGQLTGCEFARAENQSSTIGPNKRVQLGAAAGESLHPGRTEQSPVGIQYCAFKLGLHVCTVTTPTLTELFIVADDQYTSPGNLSKISQFSTGFTGTLKSSSNSAIVLIRFCGTSPGKRHCQQLSGRSGTPSMVIAPRSAVGGGEGGGGGRGGGKGGGAPTQ